MSISRLTRRGGAAAVLVLLVAACGGGGAKKAEAPTTVGATPSSSSSSTSTTAPPPPVSPLTGLPQSDAAKLARVAIVLKIDNVDPARPQAGLGAADVVYEELVESQLTRLIAVFQSTDSDRIGPVRSTRTTDIDVVSSLNRPLYGYSGGNTNFVAQLRAAPVVDVGADAHGGAYFTSGPHGQPHNLYTSTGALYPLSPKGSAAPTKLFTFLAAGQAQTAVMTGAASHLDLSFGMNSASWDWDGASQTWKRGQNGSADVDQAGQQLAAANVIVQVIPYTTDGYASGEGVYPAPPIPKGQTVGSGPTVILTGGKLISGGHWSKSSSTAVTQFTDASNQPVALTPGRTWVELAPVGTPLHAH